MEGILRVVPNERQVTVLSSRNLTCKFKRRRSGGATIGQNSQHINTTESYVVAANARTGQQKVVFKNLLYRSTSL